MQFHIIGSIVITLLSVFIFTFLSYVYWQNIKSIKSYQKHVLMSLRTISLMFIIFLILNPWFQWSKQIEIRENLSIYLDSSTSMQNQLEFDNIEIGLLKSQIDEWSNNNNVDNEWYLFGEEIRGASIRKTGTFLDSLTDFSQLPDHMIINNGGQSILITDGQSNRGMDVKYLQFDEALKIHVIGVGSDQILDDLWIENISAPTQVFVEDSVNIKLTIGYELLSDTSAEIIFHVSEKDNHSIPIKISLGKGFIDIESSFIASQLIGLNKIEVYSEIKESDVGNNIDLIDININLHKKGVLLISGGLSPNTHLIKNLVKELPSHTLTHLYKKNNIEWNLEFNKILEDPTIQLIIFDDFPGAVRDASMYEQIIQNSLWGNLSKIYFEGPKSNASTGEILSEKLNSHVKITDSINDLKINYFNEISILKTIDLASIPPSKKQMIWESDAENIIYGFDDNSVAVVKENNFYGVFIQDAHEVVLSENKNHQSALKKVFSNLLLHVFTGDENLLEVSSDKQKYMANLSFSFNIDKSPMVDAGIVEILIQTQNGEVIKNISLSATESTSPPQFISVAGDYKAIASIQTNGGGRIESRPFHFRIMGNLIEEDNLFENKNDLQRLAWKNEGTYSDPNHLEVVLSALKSYPKSQLKEYKFSALSTQRYWWVLIILLSIEWFLRKREGLL